MPCFLRGLDLRFGREVVLCWGIGGVFFLRGCFLRRCFEKREEMRWGGIVSGLVYGVRGNTLRNGLFDFLSCLLTL